MTIQVLLVGASMITLGWAGAAGAQTTAPPHDSASASTVQEVVVTAERRTTKLQTTPIAATVLSGKELKNKGVNNVDQLQFIAPDIVVNNFGQGVDFDIRGIGKAEHNGYTTPGVITYRDDVATFPGYFTEEPYFDIANIQVLRGPQGTFAGQNAIGGAVFVTSQNPVIGGGYHGYVQAQAGNYADFGAQGAVNLPISDTLAMRVAVNSEIRNSFYDISLPNGGKYPYNQGDVRQGEGRISLLWTPSAALTVLFKTDFDYLDNGAYPADPFSDRFQYLPGSTTPNPNYRPDLFKITSNENQLAVDQFVRSSLKVDYELPNGFKIQSISAGQFGNSAYKADLYGPLAKSGSGYVDNSDIWDFHDDFDETIYSQEVDLISPASGRLTWVVGLFGQYDEYNFLSPYRGYQVILPGGLESLRQGTNPETNLAGFGQVNLDLPAGFQFQVGARYTYADSRNDEQIEQYGTFIQDSQKTAANNVSYKIALNWKINESNFLYSFIATGFKPGGLNYPTSPSQVIPSNPNYIAPFQSETLTDYEVGWKSTLFGGRLRTQLDGFYNDFDKFQVSVGSPSLSTALPALELNDPSTSKLYGVEAEAQAVFGKLSFDGGIAVMHSEMGAFYVADPRVANTASVCNPSSGPAGGSCLNVGGHPQPYAPNFTLNASAQYQFDLDGGDMLTPRINFAYLADQWATIFDNPTLGDHLSARRLLGAQLAWSHRGYVVTLYGSNLLNDQYVAALNSNLDYAGPPRQFGIRLIKSF